MQTLLGLLLFLLENCYVSIFLALGEKNPKFLHKNEDRVLKFSKISLFIYFFIFL